MGTFFVIMGVIQALPGNGFWQGRVGTNPLAGNLVTMTSSMSQTPQPHLFVTWINWFTALDSAHGWAVNLLVVLALISIGIALWSRRPSVNKYGVLAADVLCLAVWVLVQDFGFFGGVGTDPNSMIPIALVVSAGFVATVRFPGPVVLTTPEGAPTPTVSTPWYATTPTLAKVFGALTASAMVLVGAVPMVAASVNSTADPIIAQSIDGSPGVVNRPAPAFTLQDATGKTVSLASFRGKVVALTFLDPVCVTDCPLLAQEFNAANRMLGGSAKNVDFVAVVANPLYLNRSYLQSFNRQEGLQNVRNWYYLTGSLTSLSAIWRNYGVQIVNSPTGAMVGHNDVAYVIDRSGRERYIVNANPGTGQSFETSSLAGVLDGYIKSVLS
jgi:cytochrome oxidase Cu insertion factor (SCO1/SenC/PrrC family)